MNAAVQSCPFPSIFEVACDLELWLGEKLRDACAELLAEPLPETFHTAVAGFARSPSNNSLAAMGRDAGGGTRSWAVWLQQHLCLTPRVPEMENSRMMRRAIRKQGVSWLVEDFEKRD